MFEIDQQDTQIDPTERKWQTNNKSIRTIMILKNVTTYVLIYIYVHALIKFIKCSFHVNELNK